MQRSARAYAKINIGLLIRNRRSDGFHEIETVFHRIDLFDDLLLEPSDSITVRSSSPDAPSDETNLCHRAARLLREELGCSFGVSISLTKRIPAGAGLGGGSSDAAAVLRELPGLWGRKIDERRLDALASQLGSDVSFFLRDGSAVAAGRGEQLEYFPLKVPYTVLLCTPAIHVSTAWAYSRVLPEPGRVLPGLRESVVAGMREPALLRSTVTNDLEKPVFRHYPEIATIKEMLLEHGAIFALMSGSGSSVYGLFDTQLAAHAAGREIAAGGCSIAFTAPGFQPETAGT